MTAERGVVNTPNATSSKAVNQETPEPYALLLETAERAVQEALDVLQLLPLESWRLAYAKAISAGWHTQDVARLDIAKSLACIRGGRRFTNGT